MAPPLFSSLPLLLLLFFTFTTPAIPTPYPPTTLPLPPQPSANPHPHHHHQQQLNNIIDALVGAGDFTSWANVLSASDLAALIPLSATLFIPADDSMPPPAPTTIDPYIFPYHIVPQRLSFADLRLFKPFSRLPTLLPSKSILLTNTSLSNYTIDASHLTHPDLYATPAFTVHGIANLLDYSVYGDAAAAEPRPRTRNCPPSPREEYVGEHYYSDAGCSLCSEIWTVFLAMGAVQALKILTVTDLGR